jgi:hypothetical protein
MKAVSIALAATLACVATAGQASSVAYNSAPADTWFYGNGNDYSPANTAVLTTDDNDQLYLRWHKTFEVAPASDGNVYSFTLGTEPMSFDWGIDNNAGASITALLTIRNLGTAQTVSYDPFFIGNDNESANGSVQNSARLSFAFLSGVGFDPNVDDTYRLTLDVNGLAGGPQSLSIDAKLGAGVPEPATWAMMIGGFGFVGGALRSRRRATPRLA